MIYSLNRINEFNKSYPNTIEYKNIFLLNLRLRTLKSTSKTKNNSPNSAPECSPRTCSRSPCPADPRTSCTPQCPHCSPECPPLQFPRARAAPPHRLPPDWICPPHSWYSAADAPPTDPRCAGGLLARSSLQKTFTQY